MARIIFILAIILVQFLTIVSKIVFGAEKWMTESEYLLSSETSAPPVNFQADFESGSLTGWTATTDWEASSSEKISGNYSLKHLASASGTASSIFYSLANPVNQLDWEWSFKLKNGNWDPSSSNRFWFYLCADTTKTDQINGWAIGVNLTGSTDLLELWRIKKGKADSLIVQSDLDWNASTLAEIKVKRSARGNWSLVYQKPDEAQSKTFTGTDPEFSNFRYVGLNFNFTATRAGQVWIDDISVKGTSAPPFITRIDVVNSNGLSLLFNVPIHPASVQTTDFLLTDEDHQTIPVISASASKSFSNRVDLVFGKFSGTQLNLTISGISDLSGQNMIAETRTIPFSFSPQPGTIIINEILFDPRPGGVDFVELVNVSDYTLSIDRLSLASRNDTLGLKQIYAVSSEPKFLKPGKYLCCTKDPEIVANQYLWHDAESFVKMTSFPSYSDDSGIVVLLNDSLQVLDELSYSYKMHSSFLADEEGVSLERIFFEKPATDRNNWASAAASVGYASPGLPNSQTPIETAVEDEITVDPEVVSPNGDGYNDQLILFYSFDKPGYMATVKVFDMAGRQIKTLTNNQSLAQQGTWTWDGKGANGQRMNLGVYIILVEIFDQQGHRKVFKKTAILSDRLN
jgi:hypothetical protein